MLKNYFCLDDKFIPAQQLATSLIELATARGINKQKLLRGTGIFYEDLSSDIVLISPAQLLKLIERTRQLAASHDISFLLGRRLFPGHYGAVSTALTHSRNLTDLFRILNLYQAKIAPFVYSQIEYTHTQAIISLNDAIGCGDHFQFILETYCAAFASAIKFLTGERISFQFDFQCERQRHIQEYEENLGYKIRFNQPLNQIRINKTALNTPLLNASAVQKKHALYLLKQAQLSTTNKPTCHFQYGFLAALASALTRQADMTLDTAAAAFNMSPASFKRKLKQHGVRYLAMQDKVNKQKVLSLLQQGVYSNESLANKMGFNDIANFRRAFKRWLGMPPSDYKAKYCY